MMKAFVTTVLILAAGSFSYAEDFGVGVILGDPSGLSGKAKIDPNHAIDAAFAYSSGKRAGLRIHGDYLWDRARMWETKYEPIYMYYGLGARLISINDGDDDGEISFGPRAPIGISYNINNPNLEFFGEAALILELTPDIEADLDVGVGARIRF